MGQVNSNESKLFEPIKDVEHYKLFQWTHFKDLKRGEKYQIVFESYLFEGIFCYYDSPNNRRFEYCHNCNAVFRDETHMIDTDDSFEYYKIISKKEYMEKMRDKYNEIILNKILKRLINEEFKW